MEWKLQLIALVLYLSIIVAGFLLLPKEPPLFGMGMIPGPLALLSRIGIPLIAAIGISLGVYWKSKIQKGVSTVFFLFISIIVWVLALILFH